MNTDDQVYMVCLPDLPEYQNSRIPGCVKGHCVKCGLGLMVAPSSIKKLREEPGCDVICIICYFGTAKRESVRAAIELLGIRTTEAQFAEVAQSKGPEAARKLREFFRQRDGN